MRSIWDLCLWHTLYLFLVTRGLETFDIKIYPNGTETTYNGYVSFTVQLLESRQTPTELSAAFSIRAGGDDWIRLREVVLSLNIGSPQLYSLTLLSEITNKANRMLDDDGIFTIRMTISYLIHSQHTIATSPTKFNSNTHTSVDMTYTWTLCNLTLPMVDTSKIISNVLFDGLGVAMCYIYILPVLGEALLKIIQYLGFI
jgi:hypothetical protein